MSEAGAGVGESVMAGRGYYSAHSRPQHAAASVAYPYLAAGADAVPAPPDGAPLRILDLGCAGGANEMEPMALAVDHLRAHGIGPVEVAHTDLPENDFGPLFELLGTPASYTHGRTGLYPSVIGRTLYGPLLPDGSVHLGWSGITLHWLSAMPLARTTEIYANLTAGAEREALRRQAEADWTTFLDERARELVDGGEVVLVSGASRPDGSSGAEALFTLIGGCLRAMVHDGELRADELGRLFYPTWNRTPEEWLAPFAGARGASFEVVASRLDASDDTVTFPQYRQGHDAAAFAHAYVAFVRAVTEHPFFRWLDADRTPAERADLVERFYRRLEGALVDHPEAAAVWHVFSLRLRRRPR